MSKATAAITDQFKNTYVVPLWHDTEELQKAYFAMGFRWYGGNRELLDTPATYIRVNEDCELHFCSIKYCPEENGLVGYREVSVADVFSAAEHVRKIKRQESKAQKKRAAARKWDATARKRTTENCPVRRDVVVSAKLECGDVITCQAGKLAWDSDVIGYTSRDIVSYKVLKPNKHKPKPVVGDWIDWDGTDYTYTGQDMSGPVPMGTLVDVKFRGGEVLLSKKAGSVDGPGTYAAGAYWVNEGTDYDIVAYRLSAPTEEKVVTVDEFFHEVCEDMGKSVAKVEVQQVSDTNPKKQYGVSSVPLNMWSPLASAYGSLALYNGSLKYGKANFANTPVEASIYVAAAMRHLLAWACGQEDDPADGVPNLGGVLANVAILLESRAEGMLIDDRLLMSGYLKEIDMLKAKVKHLNELHAGKAPKHYTRNCSDQA